MIDYSTTRANENVDASAQLAGLLIHTGAAVDGQHIILTFMMLQKLELFRDLNSQLSCWSQNHGLRFALPERAVITQTRNHGQTKAKGLS